MNEYRIYLDEVTEHYRKGYLTVTGLVQVVIELTKPSLPIEDVQGFCKQYSISKSAFYKATKKLQDSGHYPITEQNSIERKVRDRLHTQLGGLTEVATPAGRIDLLTSDQIVEVKEANDWKAAMGHASSPGGYSPRRHAQVLAYSGFYPEHQKRIHLFGKAGEKVNATALAICNELGINVTFEEVTNV